MTDTAETPRRMAQFTSSELYRLASGLWLRARLYTSAKEDEEALLLAELDRELEARGVTRGVV